LSILWKFSKRAVIKLLRNANSKKQHLLRNLGFIHKLGMYAKKLGTDIASIASGDVSPSILSSESSTAL
jgi:hypothetical protein